MAIRWTPKALAVAEVQTIEIVDTWATADYIEVTINTKTIRVTLGSTQTPTGMATALAQAWNGETLTASASTSAYGNDIAEFSEITAEASGADVILTHDTPGTPFTVSVAVNTAGDGDASVSTTTAATGPNHWNDADNWSGAAVPIDTDDVEISDSDVSILYGLSNASVDLTSLTIAASYTGRIGLPEYNADGDYYEYRTKYLTLGTATTVDVGAGDGPGSSRIKLSLGSNATTVNVRKTGGRDANDGNVPPLLILGTNASNVINVIKGDVGSAIFRGEAATWATVRLSFRDNREGDAVVRLGKGCTLTTIQQEGGVLESDSDITTINRSAGSHTIWGGTVTTLNDSGGLTLYNSTGTVTTANLSSGSAGDARLDFRGDMRSKTATTVNVYGRAKVYDPFKVVTFTNGIDLEQTSLADAQGQAIAFLDLGHNLKVTRGTVS